VPAVCLIRPRAGESFRFSAQSLSLPLGLAYIAGALEAAGVRVAVIDAVGEAPRRRTRYFKGYLVGLPDGELAARIPPDADIVGISVLFTHEWPSAVRLVQVIRRARPELAVVLGGEHVTALPEFCLATCAADVLVLGEGEETIVELIAALRGTATGAARVAALHGVDGIAFRDGVAVVVNRRRARRLDVDAIPRPAWRHFRVPTYHEHGFVGGVDTRRVTVPILATRGCPYQCTYCTNPNMWTTRWVPRDPVAVVDEIEAWIAAYGARNFPLQDLTAIVQRDWIVRFCSEIIARGLDIRWQMPTGTRAEAVDGEVAVLLRRSGMIGMAYAPEAGSDDTRRIIKKQMDADRLLASIAAASGAGLNVALFLVIGFPHDSHASLRENLAFTDRAVEAGATEVSLGYYMALPGTELFDSLLDAGRIRFDRAYFGHILQSTELLPSQSYCERLGRLALTWWNLRVYARFFRSNWTWSRRRRQASAAQRAVTGQWDREDGSKLPDALRFALRSGLASLATRMGPRWLPRREEESLMAGWDGVLHAIRAAQLASGSAEPGPADTTSLQAASIVPRLRRQHESGHRVEASAARA
jgi:anaerobic magnesium-protoporphyrin IX monomethyl ester cyclase